MSTGQQCRSCMKRREVARVRRYMGGNYKRPSTWRSTSICEQCAVHALTYKQARDNQTSQYSVSALEVAVATFSGWDKPRVTAFFNDLNERYQALRDARENPWSSVDFDGWALYLAAKETS